MATVPVQTLPTQQLSTQTTGPVQPGPAVQPMQNKAPEQMQAFGQTVTKAATQMGDIALKLQDQFNDTRSKELYNSYARELQGIETNFLSLKGKDASGQTYGSSVDRLEELRKEYMAQADNGIIGQLFAERSDVLITSSASQMTKHSITQGNAFELGESKSEVAINLENAARYWADYREPEGKFNTFAATAIAQANAVADKEGYPVGSFQRQEIMNNAYTTLHTNVVRNMMTDNQFILAEEYLAQKYKDGEIKQDSYSQLVSVVNTAATRERGVDAGTRMFQGSVSQNPNMAGTFEAAAGQVLSIEGGYVEDDAGRGPTKYGINGEANGLTREQVMNLTQDQALSIYKEKYWDSLNIDQLPVELRNTVFDAAVNQGQPTAKKMLKELIALRGDYNVYRNPDRAQEMAEEFNRLRIARYGQTLESARFKDMPAEEKEQYRRSWANRLTTSTQTAVRTNSENGLPNLADMTAQIRQNGRPRVEQDLAIAEIKDLYSAQEAATKQAYENVLKNASEIALAAPGGFKNIPPEVWGLLKPEDQAKMVEGPQRGSEPDLLIQMQNNPNMTLPGNIEKYRTKLSEADYRRLVGEGITLAKSNPQELPVILPANRLDAILSNSVMEEMSGFNVSSLTRLVFPENDDDKMDRINLVNMINARVTEAQRETKKTLKQEGVDEIINTILLDVVMDSSGVFGWNDNMYRSFEMMNEDTGKKANLYVNVTPINGTREEKIPLNAIGKDTKDYITQKFRRENFGRYPTMKQIAEEWVQAGKPKDNELPPAQQ